MSKLSSIKYHVSMICGLTAEVTKSSEICIKRLEKTQHDSTIFSMLMFLLAWIFGLDLPHGKIVFLVF